MHPTKPHPGEPRSSAWAEAIEAGEDPPGGVVCNACFFNQPRIYFAAIDRRICFDCHWVSAPPVDRASPTPAMRSAAPVPRIAFPELTTAELAALPPAARRVYLGVRDGLSYAEIGRRAGVSQESVGQAARRLLATLQRRARLEG